MVSICLSNKWKKSTTWSNIKTFCLKIETLIFYQVFLLIKLFSEAVPSRCLVRSSGSLRTPSLVATGLHLEIKGSRSDPGF